MQRGSARDVRLLQAGALEGDGHGERRSDAAARGQLLLLFVIKTDKSAGLHAASAKAVREAKERDESTKSRRRTDDPGKRLQAELVRLLTGREDNSRCLCVNVSYLRVE